MKTIESLREEYGLRRYSGVRIGCLAGYTGFTGNCTRTRHFFKHQIDGEVETVATIVSRLKKEESWRLSLGEAKGP